MTNAISEICNIAKDTGYKSLVAYALPNNLKSQNTAKRAGFKYIGEIANEQMQSTVVKLVKRLII